MLLDDLAGTTLWAAAISGVILLMFAVAQVVYFVVLIRWADGQTKGTKYYGRTLAERRQFKKKLSQRTLLVRPLLWVVGRLIKVNPEQGSFVYEGVAGPKDSCSGDSYHRAANYRPTEQDVFVVTQMKCGTTWMQHLVYQVLTRGRGDLVETGQALYAVSPWIEGNRSVSISEAPLIEGEQPRRIIKTHLPTSLCPVNHLAKYIYVSRHPASCFASTVDFVRMNLGPLDVNLETFEQWFCSDRMWWGAWPEHVTGWWKLAQDKPNVLFVRFEEMKQDLGAVAVKIAAFLEVANLTSKELDQIRLKCSFRYMQEHSEMFEMIVPTVLQSSLSPFVSGEIDRHKNVPKATRQRIVDWCHQSMTDPALSLADLYGDVEKSSNVGS